MAPNTRTKQVDGKTLYWCRYCETWDPGQRWDGADFSQIICTGCDETFDSEPASWEDKFLSSPAWDESEAEE